MDAAPLALKTCFAPNAYDARGYIFPPPQLLIPVTKPARNQCAGCCGRGSACISKRHLREPPTSLWQTPHRRCRGSPPIHSATSCVQISSGIEPTRMPPMISSPRIQHPDPLATTGSKIIEQSKQLIRAADIDYAGRNRWAWMNPRLGGDRSGREGTEWRRVD